MNDLNSNSLPDDLELDGELRDVLAETFGDDALGWLQEDDSELDADFAAAAQAMLAEENTVPETAAASNPLGELLDRLSAAVGSDAAVAPSLLQQLDGAETSQVQADLGPRNVVFQVGDQTFGLPLDGVMEIDRCGEITALPRTPAWLRGVTNLRGQILSVTDFRNLLEIEGSRLMVGEKIIVVHSKTHDASTAVVVDRVIGIRNLKADSGPLAGLNDRVATFASGIAAAGANTTVLIDPDLLLGCTELQAFVAE